MEKILRAKKEDKMGTNLDKKGKRQAEKRIKREKY